MRDPLTRLGEVPGPMQHPPKEQTVIDVKFNEAMEPLVKAMDDAHLSREDPVLNGRKMAAAVVEALGIPAQVVASPTFRYVLAFAVEMEKRLALPENRAKGDRAGWMTASPSSLLDASAHHGSLLEDHLDEVEDTHGSPDRDEVLKRTVNAANFLMMVADRTGALKVPANGAQFPPTCADEPEAVTATCATE